MDVLSYPINRYFHVFSWNNEYFLFDVSTHSLFQTDQDVWTDYARGNWTSSLLELLNEGQNNGYFIPEQYTLDTVKDQRVVKSLCFMLTRACNFRCSYCFENQQPSALSPLLMETSTARTALDWLIRNSGSQNQLEIDFFGGEPLMAFPVIHDTVLYARALEKKHHRKFMFSLTTNASLLNDEIINFLKEHHISAILSLDGSKKTNDLFRKDKKGHGTYQRSIKKILKLIPHLESGYYVRGTFTHQSLHFSKEVRHLYEMGIKQISFEPVASLIHGLAIQDEDLPVLRNEYQVLTEWMLEQSSVDPELKFYHFEIDLTKSMCKEKLCSGCGAGVEYLALSPGGEFYPCHQFDGRKEYLMGSIQKDQLDCQIGRTFAEKTWFFSRSACKDCWARTLCGGGCLANNFILEGTFDIPYLKGCALQKLRLEAGLYYQARIAQKKSI